MPKTIEEISIDVQLALAASKPGYERVVLERISETITAFIAYKKRKEEELKNANSIGGHGESNPI